MKKNSTPLVDVHLQSIQGMQEAGTDDFFYTRLRARIDKERSEQGWSLPLKPVWILSTLVLLLVLNGITLLQQAKTKTTNTGASTSSLQNFAESYDQSISSY
ncbi:MAG: hypothetical protein IPI68_07365 [Chitinophagaceae bacterium]|nr:hypothetical protein [Chitinophagaceae bacterium]